MSHICINLPTFSGVVEAGIAACINKSVSNDKLPISVYISNEPAPIAVIKQNALVWALDKYTDVTARRLFLNGICGIMDCGLLCESDGLPDGDWVKKTVTLEETETAIASMVKILNIESMKNAIEVAIATKVDFWLTDNLIGQGQVAGYTKEVLETLYPYDITDQVVSAARSLGCYISTLYVLRLAGIAGIKVVHPFVKNKGTNFTISNNLKLRFQTMPAGTHKLSIAYNAAKKLIGSVYAPFCPDVTDFEILPSMYNRVMESPANYHMSASYLTGQPRADYQNSDMDNYLGRLGTFIITLYKHSPMAKSPHMTRERVEDYPDYDLNFKATLIRMQASKAIPRGRISEEHVSEMAVITKEKLDMVQEAFKTARI